jgi:hypothetical protein
MDRIVNGPGPARSLLWSESPGSRRTKGTGTAPGAIIPRWYTARLGVSSKKAARRAKNGEDHQGIYFTPPPVMTGDCLATDPGLTYPIG